MELNLQCLITQPQLPISKSGKLTLLYNRMLVEMATPILSKLTRMLGLREIQLWSKVSNIKAGQVIASRELLPNPNLRIN